MPVGTLVTGIVSKITAFGAFVELPNCIEALVHVTELSDQPFGKVEDVVNKGEEVTAKSGSTGSRAQKNCALDQGLIWSIKTKSTATISS